MDVLTHASLRQLVEAGSPPCVSIYMPTHRTGRDLLQDPARLRDLLKDAHRQLEHLGLKSAKIDKILGEGRRMVEDEPFWQGSDQGLALFLSDGFFAHYRLPIEVDDFVYVNQHFYVRPLAPLLTDHLYYVLAVSLKAVRLIECHEHYCRVLSLPPDVATSIEQAILGEDEHQTHTLRHGGDASNVQSGGGAWHGQAQEIQQKEHEDTMFFLRQLDEGVRRVLKDQDSPVVLAGVDSLVPFYRKASSLRNLHPDAILGSPDHVASEDLADKARQILAPLWHKQLNQLQERYGAARGQGIAGAAVEEILPAAAEGRVDTLFVPQGVSVWGQIDPASGRVLVHGEPEPGDEDLIDTATAKTLLTSGRVVALLPEQIPGNRELAAIYRY